MRIAVTLLAGVLVIGAASGCALYTAPVIPPMGYGYTHVTAPLDVDVDDTNVGEREGRSSTVAVLGLFAYGDASIHSAAKEGRLSIIDHADYEYINILGIWQKFTTIVYGRKPR
jgi:hypothetical protein